MAAAVGWAGMSPGPELAARLSSLDPTAVPNAEVVEMLAAAGRQVAHSQAVFYAAMAEVGRAVPFAGDDAAAGAEATRLPRASEWASCEIAAALTYTGRRADAEFAFCQVLVRRLPLVWDALSAGALDVIKARMFAEYLEDLTEAQVQVLCARFVGLAAGWTSGQLRARLGRAVQHIDRDFYRRRYQKGIRERGISGWLAADGTATVSAHGLSPAEAAAATERLEHLADAIKAAGHPATIHQLRADLMMRLLDGRFDGFTHERMLATMLADPSTFPSEEDRPRAGSGSRAGAGNRPPPSADRGRASEPGSSSEPGPPARVLGARYGVEVRIGLSTLLGLDEHPAELPGWGPILAEEARALVALQEAAEWRFAVTDPDGYLIHGGLTRARPHRAVPTTPCRGGVVELHIPATLLADLVTGATSADEQVLARWGPVIAAITRHYADRDAAQRRLDIHPTDRYARAALRRHVQIRDRTCIFPGCRRPARKTEQDHTLDHRHGGLTVRANLEPLCELHHLLKHAGGWRLEQPEPGRFRWRSPLGRIYWTRGEPISPDLPDPIPRGPGEAPDLGGSGPTDEGPILPPRPRPDPPPTPPPI